MALLEKDDVHYNVCSSSAALVVCWNHGDTLLQGIVEFVGYITKVLHGHLSLEGCDVMNSSCKDFFFWLFDGSVERWTIVLWIDVMWVLRVCFFPSTEF